MPMRSSVLSLNDVAFERRTSAVAGLNLHLGHGETALVEIGTDGEPDLLVDVCLGLVRPARGEVHFLGELWRRFNYLDVLSRRSRIGTLVGSQVWAAHMPVIEAVLMPVLCHTDRPVDDATVEATALARRFGLPGLPLGMRETVPAAQLTRAACVRAFMGMPELVVIADSHLDDSDELALPMAQAVGQVQDRGGAVLWLLESLAAPAARFVPAAHVLRLGDRGLLPARRPA